MNLNPPPKLIIYNEGFGEVNAKAVRENTVGFSTAAMLVATPEELDAVMAHELGHTALHRQGAQISPRLHEEIADSNVALNACQPNALGSFLDKARAVGSSLRSRDFVVGGYTIMPSHTFNGLQPEVSSDNPHPNIPARKESVGTLTSVIPRPTSCKTR